MMEQYEKMSLLADLPIMNSLVEKKDYAQLEEIAHKIKSPAGYIGGARV